MSLRPRTTPFILLGLLVVAADPPTTQKVVAQTAKAGKATTQKVVVKVQKVAFDFVDMWKGDSNSLVATAVGGAEGTRTPDGGKTRAYYGHSDPGNGVWNRGSFSYQHCDSGCSPEEADRRQLARLKGQYQVIQRKAAARNLTLNVKTALNGIDLANQSPLAALDSGGYIERLAEAYRQGLTGEAAINQARSLSYISPHTGNLNAPGLGNSMSRVRADQQRRSDRISDALASRKLKGTEKPK